MICFRKEEKTIIPTIARRWAKKTASKGATKRDIKATAEWLENEMNSATTEVYQEKPFTTAVIKKVINGTQIHASGFTKYNFTDVKLGLPWDENHGRIRAIARAYNSFAQKAITARIADKPKRIRVTAQVAATIEAVTEVAPALQSAVN